MSKKPKTSNKAIREAVRVIGYLLETNGTTKESGRTATGRGVSWDDPKACKFCAVGAICLVAKKMNVHEQSLWNAVRDRVDHDPDYGLIGSWERRGKDRQAKFIEACKNA